MPGVLSGRTRHILFQLQPPPRINATAENVIQLDEAYYASVESWRFRELLESIIEDSEANCPCRQTLAWQVHVTLINPKTGRYDETEL